MYVWDLVPVQATNPDCARSRISIIYGIECVYLWTVFCTWCSTRMLKYESASGGDSHVTCTCARKEIRLFSKQIVPKAGGAKNTISTNISLFALARSRVKDPPFGEDRLPK